MKMIVAILRDEDCEEISQELVSSNFRVTQIASTGGFFRQGSTTLMIGVKDEEVEEAISIFRDNCGAPMEPGIKRVTLYVMNVDHFEQL